MSSVTVIILTKNEEKNIEKCIISAKQIAERIIVVDSGSTDNTVALAQANGAETCYHEWQGHAKQFNWALENCNIQTEWVFRLDADECVSEKLVKEISERLEDAESENVCGYEIHCSIYFMNRQLKHGGTQNLYLMRLVRFGKARVEEKLIDEHIIVDGQIKRLKGDIIHYDYKGLDTWLNKHIWYSNLELEMYYTQSDLQGGNQGQKKKRGFYYRLPLFFRARLYFWYRYYVKFGFLDGKEGKIFYYLQAYWYRFLVDAKIYENEKQNEKEKSKKGKKRKQGEK